jgi:radical SAM superfamily enzyme YgiQ (UPF0313 family)
MNVALIFPPFQHKKFEEDLKVVSDEFGVYPPLGLAYAASILEKAGHEVILIDANALKLKKEEALEKVNNFKPQLLGFMLTTYMFHDTLSWIKFFKKETKLPIVVGNINIDLYPRETLSYPEIDYGIIGPAQKSLPLLLSYLEKGKDIDHIKGLCFKKNGKVVVNPSGKKVEDFETLPFPARHLLPNDKYYQFVSKRKNFTIMITTKGCPHKCKFCYLSEIPYIERKIEDVIKEIEECYHKHGVREIDFFEPDFVYNRERTIKLCKKLIEMKLDLMWSCRARVDQVDEGLLRIMNKAGCVRIYYGIESGDQAILNKNSKGITLNQIRRALTLTKKHGIKSLGFLMVGQVGDNKESLEKTIKFIKELPLDYIQVCRTIPKPRSELDSVVIKKTGRDYWRDYLLNKEPEERIQTPWTELNEEEKLNATNRMYREFYLRPHYIFGAILNIKSFHELKRYFRAGLKFLGNQRGDLD